MKQGSPSEVRRKQLARQKSAGLDLTDMGAVPEGSPGHPNGKSVPRGQQFFSPLPLHQPVAPSPMEQPASIQPPAGQ